MTNSNLPIERIVELASDRPTAVYELRDLARQYLALRAEVERLREALPDPNKLRILADWVDFKFPNDINPEVQRDLRSWAAAIDAARKPQ